MILLAFIALISTPEGQLSSPPAQVSVRIQKASKVTANTWANAPLIRKREKKILGPDGKVTLLRLIEHE